LEKRAKSERERRAKRTTWESFAATRLSQGILCRGERI
jgi:hypothetical protein